MKHDYQQLLKPEIINSVSGLALIARVIVDGYLSGLHHSRRVGTGMEFSQYRGYEPGDDLRLLDWKMLARSGRYYIKQAEVETHIAVKFILDASNSMQHREGGLSKMEYARLLTASLAQLCFRQGDAVGLFSLNEKQMHSLYPGVQKQHFNRLLHELIQIQPAGSWPKDPGSSLKLHDRSHKELIFFLTDLYESQEELTQVITGLKSPRNEVVVLHLMGRKELDFSYTGNLSFEDLETGARLKLNASEARQHYLKALERMLEGLKEKLHSRGIGYHLFSLDAPLEEALQVFLKKRNKLL